jgi:DNA polymerase II large subunit
MGKCSKCGGKLLLTVSEGTVRKYAEATKQIIENYAVSTYLRQQFSILERRVDDLFGKKDRQLNLSKFNVN